MRVEEVARLPEKESYIYLNGPQFVCSTLVTKLWKVGGLFDGIEIESNEFTSKDNYQLDFFESDPSKLPCKIEAPEINHCIVSGSYYLTLPGYNSISPYSHMNERCPSVSPLYPRPEGC